MASLRGSAWRGEGALLRTPTQDFYGAALDGQWQFSETWLLKVDTHPVHLPISVHQAKP